MIETPIKMKYWKNIKQAAGCSLAAWLQELTTLPPSSSPEGSRAVENSWIARLWGRGREGRQATRGRGPREAVHAGSCDQVRLMRLRVGRDGHKLMLRDRLVDSLRMRGARPRDCGKESLSMSS